MEDWKTNDVIEVSYVPLIAEKGQKVSIKVKQSTSGEDQVEFTKECTVKVGSNSKIPTEIAQVIDGMRLNECRRVSLSRKGGYRKNGFNVGKGEKTWFEVTVTDMKETMDRIPDI